MLVGVSSALAQRRFGGGGGSDAVSRPIVPNTPYDGRFTFVRVRYGPDYGFTSQRLPWSHDYPSGEQHFMKIVNELSYLNPHTQETNILTFDDPELFKYPVAYLCEPGGWVLTDEEAAGLRAYLQKGGFVIVDDFHFAATGATSRRRWRASCRRRASSTSICRTRSSMRSSRSRRSTSRSTTTRRRRSSGRCTRTTIRRRRIMMMINYNTDISEFWEWSDTGLRPIDESNEAYKLGVNYIMYGMTH